MNEQLDKMDGVVEAFSVDVLKAKKLVNIGEDVSYIFIIPSIIKIVIFRYIFIKSSAGHDPARVY